MRHRKTLVKFSRSTALRKALVRSLLRAVVNSERITTTEAKAKGIRPMVERMITWAKTDCLHHRRIMFSYLGDHAMVKRLFESIGPRYKDINGGYTRIYTLGFRKGDNAKMAILELTKMVKKEKVTLVKKEKAVKDQNTSAAVAASSLKEHKEHKETKMQVKQDPTANSEKKGILKGVRKIFGAKREG